MAFKPVYELDVFKRAYKASLEIHKASLKFPQIEQYAGLADQLRRCSKSICANLVEGLGRNSTSADKKHFLRIALGSAAETRLWLRYALDLGYLEAEFYEAWRSEYEQVGRMLHGLGKSSSGLKA